MKRHGPDRTSPAGLERFRRFWADESGVASMEFTLLLLFFGLPMFYLASMLLDILVAQYQLVMFYETFPFP